MQSKAVEDLLSAMQASRALGESWGTASHFFESFGFDRLIYLDVGPARERVLSTMPGSWMARYQECDYARIDPFLRYCAAMEAPVGTGIDYLDDYSYLDSRERNVIREASESGFRAGMSCMVRTTGPMGAAGWNLGSTLPRREIERLFAEHGHVLRLAAHFSHEIFAKSACAEVSVSRPLSPRETECLQWLAGGLRTKEIAARMGISPVTVELHLRNARTKLGAQSREQAVARAIANGILEI